VSVSLTDLAAAFQPPHPPEETGGCYLNAAAFTNHCFRAGLDASLLCLNFPTGEIVPEKADPIWQPFLRAGQLIHYLTRVGEETVDFNARQLDPNAATPQLRPLGELKRFWQHARDLGSGELLWQH
jgi:hypothetical protein